MRQQKTAFLNRGVGGSCNFFSFMLCFRQENINDIFWHFAPKNTHSKC
jgi:hypothetical protein